MTSVRDAGIRRLVSLRRRLRAAALFFRRCSFRRAAGRLSAMASLDIAQLSALASAIEDLAGRSAELAEQLDTADTADTAAALFEAERALVMANRSVTRALRGVER